MATVGLLGYRELFPVESKAKKYFAFLPRMLSTFMSILGIMEIQEIGQRRHKERR